RRAVHLGDTGAGMTAKVLNNYVAGASVVAVRRVLAAAAALQLDRSQLLNEVMQHSSGNTWYGSNFDDIAWSRDGYSPDNTMGIVEKDVRCAIETMNDAGLGPGELDSAVVAALKQLMPYT
ncbi:MAG TPA: NAD-binding protein, partial [Gammaproteobacteria bacterium]